MSSREMWATVELSPIQMEIAKRIAIARNRPQRQANRLDGVVKGNSLTRDIEGAEGEIAVAVALGLDTPVESTAALSISMWDKWKLTPAATDLPGIDVRCTTYANGRLLLDYKDKADRPYVLVIKQHPNRFTIAGWCYGREGKQRKYWNDHLPRPCYAVPQSDLRQEGIPWYV